MTYLEYILGAVVLLNIVLMLYIVVRRRKR